MWTRKQATHIRIAQAMADKAKEHAAEGIVSLRRIQFLVGEFPHYQTETQADKLEGNARRGALDSGHATTHAEDAQMWVRTAKRNPRDSQRAVEGATRCAAGAERGARGVEIELRTTVDRAEEVKLAAEASASIE